MGWYQRRVHGRPADQGTRRTEHQDQRAVGLAALLRALCGHLREPAFLGVGEQLAPLVEQRQRIAQAGLDPQRRVRSD